MAPSSAASTPAAGQVGVEAESTLTSKKRPSGRVVLVGIVATVVLLAAAVVVGVGLFGGKEPDVSEDSRALIEVVSGLAPNDPTGFAPEALESIEDPSQILPDGATVVPIEETVELQGDLASLDVIVSVPGEVDTRYWVFLERRNGVWLIYSTIPVEGP